MIKFLKASYYFCKVVKIFTVFCAGAFLVAWDEYGRDPIFIIGIVIAAVVWVLYNISEKQIYNTMIEEDLKGELIK